MIIYEERPWRIRKGGDNYEQTSLPEGVVWMGGPGLDIKLSTFLGHFCHWHFLLAPHRPISFHGSVVCPASAHI